MSLSPAPTLFGGNEWMTGDGCTSFGVDGESRINGDHVIPPIDPDDPVNTVDEIRSWPASSPDCTYLGGLGFGPVRPAQRVGQGGVWVRSLAISNGEDAFVYQIADLVGWFARYDQTICSDCGILDVRTAAGEALGIPVGNIVTAALPRHGRHVRGLGRHTGLVPQPDPRLDHSGGQASCCQPGAGSSRTSPR